MANRSAGKESMGSAFGGVRPASNVRRVRRDPGLLLGQSGQWRKLETDSEASACSWRAVCEMRGRPPGSSETDLIPDSLSFAESART
jgi:hypothetical protein